MHFHSPTFHVRLLAHSLFSTGTALSALRRTAPAPVAVPPRKRNRKRLVYTVQSQIAFGLLPVSDLVLWGLSARVWLAEPEVC